MKKNVVVGILCCLLLVGCASQTNNTEQTLKSDNSVEETQSGSQSEPGFIGLFEKAEYDKYNSYASDNGLKDTLIYIEGKVLNQTKFDLDDSTMPLLALVVEQQDGNRWSVSVSSDAKIQEIQDKNVRVFGTYMGYSDVMNLPSIGVASDNLDILDEIKIEMEENGEYVTVWNFADYIAGQVDSIIENAENSSEENMSSSEEPSQESVQVYTPTMGEKNALGTAKDYLSFMCFSYKGLVEQLEFEKYSHEEAVYAADNCGADWNEQAAGSAKDYLDMMSFSRDSLIEQLEFEGFTHEQAVYGAEANGY